MYPRDEDPENWQLIAITVLLLLGVILLKRIIW